MSGEEMRFIYPKLRNATNHIVFAFNDTDEVAIATNLTQSQALEIIGYLTKLMDNAEND